MTDSKAKPKVDTARAWREARALLRQHRGSLALGLLLGGAIGNFIDRIRLGYVVDFADIGIGTWRWYIFNVADMAVSCFFLVLLAMWIIGPMLQSRGRGAQEVTTSSKDAERPVAG